MHFWILYLCKICSRSAFFLVKITKIDAHASEGGVQYLVYVKVTYDLTDTRRKKILVLGYFPKWTIIDHSKRNEVT